MNSQPSTRSEGTRSGNRFGATADTIALLGNHLPRQCGIATFTTDLADAIEGQKRTADCVVVAMNDPGKRHGYPGRVGLEVEQEDIDTYHRAADYLNAIGAGVLSVQHEYGIFGGDAGCHVLALLRQVKMPIVATLHTILREPNPSQRAVMDELTHLVDRVVVMSEHGAELLQSIHGVPERKIDLIPHGIPDVPVGRGAKAAIGMEGRFLILTFGLLSPDKGIEDVIEAMPQIVAHNPDALYIVLGATHPHVRQQSGEAYRESLQRRAEQLGVSSHVIFHNRFVSLPELTQYLSAADVYVTPYLKLDQITSGTLAYAVGSGKAVISTPYLYAQELLAGGRGVLVPTKDPDRIAGAVIDLLGDEAKRQVMCARGLEYGRRMLWPAVARSYLRSFERARADRRCTRLPALAKALRLADHRAVDVLAGPFAEPEREALEAAE